MNDESEQPEKLDQSNFTSTPGNSLGDLSTAPKPKNPKPWYKRFSLAFDHTRFTKKQWALIAACFVVIVAAGVEGVLFLAHHFNKQGPPVAQVQPTPRPTTEPSRLTGLPVNPDLNKRPITGVMIENSPDARPQSGLLDAGVVVEAIAEGGITRFLALYQEAQPSYIGPVRSVRPYYLDFVLPFQAALAHAGGSPDGLHQVRDLHVRDLDEFANGDAYWRVASRYAPHNLYTSSKNLDKVEKRKGYTSSDFTSFLRKKDQALKTPKASSINFVLSGFFYNVNYRYDKKSNSYLRSEGGAGHRDERSHKQLHPKVVIALVMSYSLASDGKHSIYDATGTGRMFLFQDGNIIKGTWKKLSRSSQVSFLDSEGKPLKLNAGQTWITLLAASSDVSYKP